MNERLGADAPRELGALEDDYELIRELGRGGTAAVYLARDRWLHRIVAIKVLRTAFVQDPEALARFAREARVLAKLQHPNIVNIYAVRRLSEYSLALVMQAVQGPTLRQVLDGAGALPAPRVIRILHDVGGALAHAHAIGVVHRDIKPDNIFLEERTGVALLSDFGIARRIEEEVELTMVGATLGTPAYMSPEQIDGRAVDERTDVYSLGVVAWQMLTGERPWGTDSLYNVIYKQKHEQLASLAERRPELPAPLIAAVEGALHKDRGARWASVNDFLAQLEWTPAPRAVVVEAEPVDAHAMEAEPAEGVPEDDVAVDAMHVNGVSMHGASVDAEPVGAELVAFERPTEDSTGTDEPARDMALVPLPRGSGELETARSDEFEPVVIRNGVAPGERRPRRRVRRALAVGLPVAALVAALIALGDRDERGDPVVEDSPSPAGTTTASAGEVAPETTISSAPVPPPAEEVALPGPRPATCESPTADDQRACLTTLLEQADVDLNRVYRDLILELRRQTNTPRSAGDPEPVRLLRVAQRKWLVDRDAECRRRGEGREGPLWAPVRAQCLAEVSARRTRDLTALLERVREF